MNDRLKWRMWSTHAGHYFDETNDAMRCLCVGIR